jgi:hypothetical protein
MPHNTTRRVLLAGIGFLLAPLLLTACTAGASDSQSPPSAIASPQLPRLTTGEIYVFDAWDQQLAAYDKATGRVTATTNVDDFYYYGFRTASRLFTAGANNSGGFSVLDVDGSKARTVTTMKPDEAVFPLAADGKRTFFVIYEYSSPGVESGRRIARLRADGSWQTYQTFSGPSALVDDGVLLDGRLYYTVYDQKTDKDTLYSVDADDPTSSPRLEKRNLSSGEVYAQGGELFLSDGTTISSRTRSFTCADLCWFYEHPAVLIRIDTENEDLVLTVFDAKSGKTLAKVPRIVGFDVHGDTVTSYTRDGVRRIDVGKAGS